MSMTNYTFCRGVWNTNLCLILLLTTINIYLFKIDFVSSQT